MKTVRIFLASSEELDYSRMAFGNLVRRLDDIYEKRGVRIKLFEWEDYDAAYNNAPKQAEYNSFARQSDMFIALFYKLANKFTLEEFDAAVDENRKNNRPQIYVYFKDLKDGKDKPSDNLVSFRAKLNDGTGYNVCQYGNRESMQFHFVMQLQLLESRRMEELKVEEGRVTLSGLPIAKMDNLPFTSANEDYHRMNHDLATLSEKIEKARLRLHDYPGDNALEEDLQEKLNSYNELKSAFESHQQLLFKTAKRVARLQGEIINERMRRAMEALKVGDVQKANIYLDKVEEDARKIHRDYRKSKEISEQVRQNAILSIEELLLKTSSVMADASTPIDDRVVKTNKIYKLAIEMARECELDREKYIDLLFDYEEFLSDYAHLDEAINVGKNLVDLCERVYGSSHPTTAKSYNNIGTIFDHKGDHEKAIFHHFKSAAILEKEYGLNHPDTATTYSNIGLVYMAKGDYQNALDYLMKSVAISEKILGPQHPDIATPYNNIGGVYQSLGDYDKAMEYLLKSVVLFERKYGKLKI